jgi:hypothetical protein
VNFLLYARTPVSLPSHLAAYWSRATGAMSMGQED